MNDPIKILLNNTVPLKKVVMAAIMDMHEDVGRVEHSFTHWASRGLKKLETESLHTIRFKALLTVNKNTRSATLPPGTETITSVAAVKNGRKYELLPTNDLIDLKNIEDIPCEDRCEKCNQNKSLCQDLTVTEETSIVEVNGQTAQLTVIKKLYPDGRYFLETITPVWDFQAETIEYRTTKEFITNIDLKPCGCIDESDENIEKIKTCCPEAWACHFAPCESNCDQTLGRYQVFEETGMLAFTKVNFDKVYIEGTSFIAKVNGQYRVPKVAFEALVEWILWKYIQHKKNVSRQDKNAQYALFRDARTNMEIVNGRVPISLFWKYVETVPKFDVTLDPLDFCEIVPSGVKAISSWAAVATENSNSGSSGSTGDETCGDENNTTCCCPAGARGYQPFQIAVIAGMGTGTPTPDVNYFQLDILKNAINLNIIFVNNTPENTKNQQFTFDADTGTIYRWQGDNLTPNNWVAGDTLIADFAKLI